MPAYSFKGLFCEYVKEGSKLHTVRAPRGGKMAHAKPGDTVYLYYGMRTKQCTKLAEGTCTKVESILITNDNVTIEGRRLSAEERDAFAHSDGFRHTDQFSNNRAGCWEMMLEFWKKEHGEIGTAGPVVFFRGVIIHWELKHPDKWTKANSQN